MTSTTTVASAPTAATVTSMLKEEDAVPRCHSLFDMETDKLLKHNQASGKLSPGWTASKYKICGSFVDIHKGNKPGSTAIAHLPSRARQRLEKKESFFDEPLDRVDDLNEMLEIKDPKKSGKNSTVPASGLSTQISHPSRSGRGSSMSRTRAQVQAQAQAQIQAAQVGGVQAGLSRSAQEAQNAVAQQIQQQQQQLNQSMSNILANLTNAQNELSQKQSALFQNTLSSVNLLKRQSLVDFEKTLQYFSPNSLPNYQNLVINGNLFGSFLSHNSSFNNVLNGNGLTNTSFDSTPSGGTPENNFDIGHVKQVEERDSLNMGNPTELSLKRKLPRGRKYETVNGRCKKRGKWSEFEDRVLQELATEFVSRKEKINFKKIADHLKGRTAKQCREHWLSTLNPDLKKGRWTKGEEIKLLDLMISHGKSWSIIAKQIPGRAEHSVKAKGRLMLGERLKTIPQNATNYNATDDQKQKLFSLHQQLGSDFDEISKQSGFIISPAKIERTMLAMCTCNACVTLVDKIKATNSSNLLQGWTKIKAEEMKKQLLKKSNKYSSPELFGAINLEGGSSNSNSGKASAGTSYNDVFLHGRPQGASPTEDGKVKRLSSFSRLSAYTNGKNNTPASLSSLRKTTTSTSASRRQGNGNRAKSDDEEEFTSAVPMLY